MTTPTPLTATNPLPLTTAAPANPLDATLLLAAFDRRGSLPVQRAAIASLAQAERINADIVRERVARGERPVGYKIGFTNRSIWPLYGVEHPVWGVMYDSTVEQLTGAQCSIKAGDFVEPRVEPEIVFGLAATPRSAALADLVAAIDWFAHGFEIVQSVYPDWKFNVNEAFAAQGMHGALKIGVRQPLKSLSDPVKQLAQAQVELMLNGELRAQGVGANVLDGPIQALAHFVAELGKRGAQLRAGDIVTTGTLTDAMPLLTGQRWTSRFNSSASAGLTLAGLELTVR